MKRLLTAVAILLSGIFATTVLAQGGYQVKGTVVDAQGPVIGATVLEQGTSNGTSTGLDGEYVLSVSKADAVVEISCIGYATQSFPASSVPASVTLLEDTEFLDDVVVIGYGTVKKSDLTGSVSTVKADEINRGAITSPSQALLGKVAGLNIIPASGQPGASATIRIRGAASLNASNDPLIVIDGVPVTGDGGAGMGDPLASVNPNDIESFSVLKDASATAIYGSRASNGVIIITTKKGTGTAGKIKVNYTGSISLKQNSSTIDMMSGDQFRDYIAANHPEKLDFLTDANTDWQKQIYRIAIQTDHVVSATGGKKVPFRASLGYNLDQATLKTGDNQRGNIDVSLSPKLFKEHLSINANFKGIYQTTNWANTGAIGNALAFDPTKPVRDEHKKLWNWYSGNDPNSMASVNPLSTLYEYYNNGKTLRSIGNLQLDYKIHGFEDLRLNVNGGYDVAKTRGEQYNILGTYTAAKASPDLANKYVNYNRNLLLEAYADYSHEFKWCNLDVMAGYSWQHNYVRYDNTSFYNKEPRFLDEDIYYESPTNAKEYYLMSFFGRANFSVLSRYLFTVTYRADASSRFGPNNKWGHFPSAAFAWNIKEESFLKNVAPVSALKLRLGWGRTGQQDIGSDYYPYLARYEAPTVLNMRYNMGEGRYNVLAPQAYNPNIKWETTETYNVGVDFGFLNDRITGSVEAYYRKTFDLLNVVPAPLGANFSNVIISNIGSMVNKGIEFNLNAAVIETKDWHWSIGANLTLQDTKITKLTAENAPGYLGVQTGSKMGGTDGYTSLHRIGYSPYTFHLFEQLFDENGKPVENGLVDRDGDGRITDSDRYVTGYSPTPRVFYGINTRVSYKNWDFSLSGHGSFGNYAINKVAMAYSSSYSDDYTKGYVNNLSNAFLIDGWTDIVGTNQMYSDLFIENASFFKIDDINLGYTFKINPEEWLINSIRVAASVQNVCTFTKYSGLDPELTSLDGVDDNIVPRPRLFTLRVSVNF
ncbi:MAG: TonB-dependent receptor [Bacteroidales bacterium]|nr:TonB-dependent receptor [Bacteroidales bacterium]